MKTFNDLTDEQLIELTRMLSFQFKHYHADSLLVERGNPLSPHLIRVLNKNSWAGLGASFDTLTGAFHYWVDEKFGSIQNPFAVVDKCREWGLSY